MRYRTTAILFSLVLFAAPAFAHMSAGELSLNCDAVTAERSYVWDSAYSGACEYRFRGDVNRDSGRM
jgi:hypothetical protein